MLRARIEGGTVMRGDDGVSLIEVIVAFIVLLVALIPLAYLYTTAVTQAGQAKNQITALSLAEKWSEILSNVTPPVNNCGEVIVNKDVSPSGPVSNAATTTAAYSVTGTGVGCAGSLTGPTTVALSATTTFAAATSANPQVAVVTTSTGKDSIFYTGTTCTAAGACSLTGVSGWSQAESVASGAVVAQAQATTDTETKGSTVYALRAEYEWTSYQSGNSAGTTIASGSNGVALATASTISLASVANFTSSGTVKLTSSTGIQTVTYTGVNKGSNTLTGVTCSGCTGTLSTGTAVVQRTSKPNLCTSGSPQLLKLRMTVSWGPSADVNQVQDSVILNYPPSGIQTLGFIALQFSGDSTANDAQGNPWSERVQSIPVTITGPQNLTIYPDAYGCAFAQVLPGSTYTVSVGNAASGTPAGTTYGSPAFTANAAGVVTSNVLQQPQTETQSGITVSIGAVTNLTNLYASSFPAFDQGTTVNLAYPSSTAAADGVLCPGTGGLTCLALGSGPGGAQAELGNAGAWSTLSVPGTTTRLSSQACAGTTECILVGNGGGKGVILNASTATSPALTVAPTSAAIITSAGVTALTQVACPTSTNCVAIGTTATGAVALADTITSGVDSWTAITLPAAYGGLSSLSCPSGGGGCAAIATTSGTSVVVSGPLTGAWVANAAPAGFTISALTSLACATAVPAACVVDGTGTIGAGALGPMAFAATSTGLASQQLTLAYDTFPTGTTPTGFGNVICPSSGRCLITTSTGSGPVLLASPPAAGALVKESLPTVTSIGQVLCPSTTTCLILGANGSTPLVLTSTGVQTSGSTADTFTAATLSVSSGTLSTVTQVACASTTACAVVGTGTSASSQPTAFLLGSSGGIATFTAASLPATNQALYLGDVDCTTSGSPTYCSAAGAGPYGAVILSSSTGPTGTWTNQTPSGLTGSAVAGVPIEMNNANLLPNTYATAVTAGAVANINQLPDLYPFSSGYALFAGDCAAELGAGSFNIAQAATTPGAVSSATVPLGLLEIRVNRASGTQAGQGYPNIPLSLTANTTGCGADTYTLPASGTDGLSRILVPYGSYSLKVNNVTQASSIVVGGSSVSYGLFTFAHPNPVPVSA